MKTDLTDINDTRKNLRVEIPSDVVDAEIYRVTRDYSRRVRIPGFRPGKAPARVIKQRFKEQEFARLRGEYGKIVPAEANNAFLVSIAVYTELVPAFERLLAEKGGDLSAFYARVRELAHEDKKARQLALR